MNLTQQELSLFYKLWYGLIWGVNEKHKIIPHFKKPVYGTNIAVSTDEFVKIRNAIWENPKLIDEFLASQNNGEFTQDEREAITNWRKHFVKGKFLVIKHLAKYSVLMPNVNNTMLLYGVHGISDPIKHSLTNPLPVMAEFVLLPFNDKIIYDTFIMVYSISFGPGIRSSIKEQYTTATNKYGIMTVLDGKAPVIKLPTKKPEKQSKIEKIEEPSDYEPVPEGVKVPKTMAWKYNEIAKIISDFADEMLNDEYKEISLRALEKLCRKRPSPLMKGKPQNWACGIVYAIGSSNFIFDKSQPIHMTGYEIADWFGLSKSTAGSKASEVSKALNISYMNAEFLLKSLIDKNPAIWYLQIDGLFMDIRTMPREIQEQAFKKGLIPYIPADKR